VHPSPFRPARDGAALVVVRSPGAPSCRIAVYDSWGQEVADLVPWTVGAGEHRALWDGRDGAGSPAPLGLYIVRADGPGLAAVHGTVVVDR
jgi:flagellar hook assembly protein FlgD